MSAMLQHQLPGMPDPLPIAERSGAGLRPHGKLGVIFDLMRAGGWMTAEQVQHRVERATGRRALLTSVSAQIRDLRKPKYGGHLVARRAAADGGACEYRLVVDGELDG